MPTAPTSPIRPLFSPQVPALTQPFLLETGNIMKVKIAVIVSVAGAWVFPPIFTDEPARKTLSVKWAILKIDNLFSFVVVGIGIFIGMEQQRVFSNGLHCKQYY